MVVTVVAFLIILFTLCLVVPAALCAYAMRQVIRQTRDMRAVLLRMWGLKGIGSVEHTIRPVKPLMQGEF